MQQERILEELQSRAHLSSFQLILVTQYMEYAHAVGYDEGRLHSGGQTRMAIQSIKNGKIVKTFSSQQAAARFYAITQQTVSKIIKGTRPPINGFHFKLAKRFL
jgi:hypothetical protein